jgi:hypothetical protein
MKRRRQTTWCWSAAFVAAMIATPAIALRSVSRAELNGEWTGPIALDAGTQMLALVFRATDSTLAGTVYSDGDKFGEMDNPSLSGNTVHFKLDRLDFTGVIEATTMKVSLIVYNGSTRHLTLKKTPVAGGDSSSTTRKPPAPRP